MATAPGGVARLRELILTLAVQGKLVPQDLKDEPASELLKKIRAEKDRLIAEGKIKRDKPLAEITEEEKPFGLPVGWEWVRLPEIYYSISPSGNKLLSSAVQPEGKHPVVDQGQRHIAGYTNNDSLLIEIPGPVIVFGDHTKEIKYIDFDFVAGADGTKILRPVLQDERFFTWQLRSFPLEDRGYARHFKVLNSCLFALPPVAEQSRIVTRVEELMRLCDALEAKGQLEATQHAQLVNTLLGTLTESETPAQLADNWHRSATHFDLLLDRPDAVDALEQTILQLAVRGLLVPQDPQDEPASGLLKKIRAEKDKLIAEGKIKRDKPLSSIAEDEQPFALPVAWEWTRMGDAVNSSEAGWSPTCIGSPRRSGHWGVLKVSAVSWGAFDANANKELPADLAPRPEYEVQDGDFLLSRANTEELVARSVVVGKAEPLLMLSDKIIRLDVSSLMNRDFLNLCNNANHARAHYIANASGTSSSMKNVSREVVLRTPVPLPPLAEQSRIVTRVTQLRRLCADLHQRLTASQSTQAHLAEALVENVA
ncbi:MAG: restriction endonuclease subunit S [Rhodoferax sp.]|nr:restriction endonuclease subunit S [Rhodoferax sp.]